MRRLLLLLWICALAPNASAHQQSLSYSRWQADSTGLQAVLRHQAIDLTRAKLHPATPDFLERSSDWLAERVTVRRGDQVCEPLAPHSRTVEKTWVATTLQWHCPPTGNWTIHFDGLLDVAPDHNHLARWQSGEVGDVVRVFTENQRNWEIGGSAAHPVGNHRFIALGMQHILTGWDHLAFLLALLLLVRRGRELAWLVTGFTVAHSLTLALAALDLAAVDSAGIEVVIALSILLLCLENTWRLQGGWLPLILALALLPGLLLSAVLPWTTTWGLSLFGLSYALLLRRGKVEEFGLRLALCFGFGLFHGFGFAGVLLELQIPVHQQIWSLLGFNLGVEIGQLLCVLPAWWLLGRLRTDRRLRLAAPLNAATAGLASYWLTLRLFG